MSLHIYYRVNVPMLDQVTQAKQDKGTTSTNKGKSAGNTVTKEISSLADWNAVCGNNSRKLCAVWFGEKSSTDGNMWDSQVQTWNNVQKSLISSGNTAVQAYNFVILDARCQSSFIESIFGLTTMNYNIPTIVVLSPVKSRYAVYSGSITQEVSILEDRVGWFYIYMLMFLSL